MTRIYSVAQKSKPLYQESPLNRFKNRKVARFLKSILTKELAKNIVLNDLGLRVNSFYSSKQQ